MKTLIEKLVQISAAKATPIDNQKLELLKTFDNSRELDMRNLFMYWFNAFPNIIDLGNGIRLKKVLEHILSQYSEEIKDVLLSTEKEKRIIGVTLWLYDDVIIELSDGYGYNFEIYYRTTPYEKVAQLVQEISAFKKKEKKKPQISLIHHFHSRLSTTRMDVKLPKLSIEDNYNDDFLPVHETILTRLQTENDKGLVLLHGKPGTGKTYYLRYLISQLRKDVIFCHPIWLHLLLTPD